MQKVNLFVSKLLFDISKKEIIDYYVILLCSAGLLQLLGGSADFALRQLIFAIFGFFLFFTAKMHAFRSVIKFFILPLYILTVLLLVFVLFTQPINGASRWFNIFGFSIQPSEFSKVSVILMISYYLTYLRRFIRNKSVMYLGLITIIFIPVALVFVQPDFGSAFLLAATCFGYIFISLKLPKKYLILFILGGIFTASVVFSSLKEFQKKRIYSYLSSINKSASDVSEHDNFNRIQAEIAIGSGGLLGKGLGSGTQSKLSFLPEDHTDFAFSSYAEQFGMIGVCILVLLYIFSITYMANSSERTVEPVIRKTHPAIIMLFILQVFVNIGMNIGLLPIVGVPLPFVSYGGSSLIVWFFMLGLF